MSRLSPDVPRSRIGTILRSLVRKKRLLKARLTLGKKLKYGDNVHFGPNSKLMIPERLFLGNDLSVGANFFVQTNTVIGDGCLISSDVSFVGNDHFLDDPEGSAYWSGRTPPSTVELKGNNFVGYRSTIVGNVVVGRGAVIGAGSVVVKDVEEYSVVAGVPARHIRFRNH